MRTKTLLLAVATLAVGFVSPTADAQVYSQNVVGYIKQVIPKGFSMIANQMDYDGTGTNNTLAHILPSPPNFTRIYKFTGTGFTVATYRLRWSEPSMTLNPGEGAFIDNLSGSPITNTFVGTVLQGTFTNAVPAGFTLQGYNVPISGGVSAKLGYPVVDGDYIYMWNNTNSLYAVHYHDNGEWIHIDGTGTYTNDIEPTISVGQSFFVNRQDPTNWVVNFQVSTNQ